VDQAHALLSFLRIAQLGTMTQAFHLICHPATAASGFHRYLRRRRKPSQKLTVKLTIVSHAQRFARVLFFIRRANFLGASHAINCSIMLQHLHSKEFWSQVYKNPRQRFHSINLAENILAEGTLL